MISIQDPNEVLSAAQVRDLQARSAAYPFEVKVLIDGQAPSKLALESHVASMVTGPHQLVIGIAPTHHFTFVKGSVDLGLPSGPAIASAGNPFFKAGDMVSGIDAIAARALSLRTDSRVMTSQTGVPIVVQQHTTSAGVWWLLGGVVLLALAVTAYILWRNRRRDAEHLAHLAELDLEAATYRGRNLEEQAWAEKVAATRAQGFQGATSMPGPLGFQGATIVQGADRRASSVPPRSSYAPAISSPPPVIVNNSSSSLDNLLAFELGSEFGRHDRIVEREVVVERGGSASNWESDSGSSSSSSSDTGGGGFDFGGGGGGSDWGGGDIGGGGGSDW